MRIALVISSLGAGGAERVVANLANGLVSRGHHVLVATYRDDKPDFYELAHGVQRAWFRFDVSGTRKVGNLRACLQAFGPDWVISHINKTNIRCLWAGLGQPWKTIVTEHNDPKMQPIEPQWNLLRHLTYPFARWVVGVSRGVLDAFPWVAENRKVVAPNGVPEHPYRRSGAPSKRIVAMGRLIPIKGFDRLIEAFDSLGSNHVDATLTIWGEGGERKNLQDEIDRRGLSARVLLKGLTSDPFAQMARSDLLVCSSISEGFGNVLVEAMSCGVPVVSFDCPTGPREIIDSGVNGILVPDGDVPALAQAMASLLDDEALWARLAEGALASSQRFSNKAILDQWEKLFV